MNGLVGGRAHRAKSERRSPLAERRISRREFILGSTGAATIAVLGVGLVGCVGSSAEQGAATGGDERPEELRFAVTRLQGMEELQREYGLFQERLGELSGTQVEFFPVTNRTAAVEAMNAGRVDLVFTGPAEYVAMRSRSEAIPLVAITRSDYRTQIRTYEGSGIESIEDLRGKEIDVVDAGSTSGHLGTAQLLADKGIDPQADVELLYLGNAGVQGLLDKDLAASGRGGDGWEQAFTEAGVENYEERFPVVAEGPELPPDVIVASPELPEGFRNELRTLMLENDERLIDAMVNAEGLDNDKYTNSEFRPTADSDYDYMRQAYRTIGIEDFAEAPEK